MRNAHKIAVAEREGKRPGIDGRLI